MANSFSKWRCWTLPDADSSKQKKKKQKETEVDETQLLPVKKIPFDTLWPLEQNQEVIKAAFAKLSARVDLISPRPDNRYQVTWKDNSALLFLTRPQLQQVGWTGHVYPRDDSLSDSSSSSPARPAFPLSLSSLSLHESPAPSSSLSSTAFTRDGPSSSL